MIAILVADGVLDWTNTGIAVLGLLIAVVALIQTRKSNHSAKEANEISRSASDAAIGANRLAQRALDLQEDEGRVHLVVKPRMLCAIGDGEDPRPRPVVEVINLSSFPVTIRAIHWRINRTDRQWGYWKNPTVALPFTSLPARVPSRESLTAVGNPSTFEPLDVLSAITAAVVLTSCGEQIEGMTTEWRDDVARLLAESRDTTSAA